MPEQKLKEEKKEEYDEERKRRELERKKQEKEGKKRVEKVSKVETPVKSIIQKTTETEVKVPILKLEKPKIEVKEVKVLKEIPYIEREKLEVKVPIIKLSSPVFEESEIRLNKDVPSIEPIEEKVLKIPLVKLRKAIVRDIISEFNSNIPESPPKPPTRVRIPIYRILRTPMVREIGLFDKKIDEKLLEKLEEKPIQTPEPQISVVSKEAEPSLGGKEEIEEELPNAEDIITLGLSKVLSGEPKVILVEKIKKDSFVAFIEDLCTRIYREVKGGKPKPTKISLVNLKDREEFKREIEKWMEARDKIFSVELPPDEKVDLDWNAIADRLKELYNQDLGFIIFEGINIEINFEPKFKLKNRLIKPIKFQITGIVDKLWLNPQLKYEFCGMLWGFVKITKEDVQREFLFPTEEPMFDQVWEVAKKMFNRKIAPKEPWLSLTKRSVSVNESDDLHFPLKAFVVEWLAKELNIKENVSKIKELIKTEEEFEGKWPDIYVESFASKFSNEIFEVETLFGEGKWLKKIDETIEKYEKISNPPKKVNIVMDTIGILLHFNEIIKKKKYHRKLKKSGKRVFDLEFWTIDVENRKLIPISDIRRKFKSLIEK